MSESAPTLTPTPTASSTSGARRVGVAMSGGLDSSVTAWLLARDAGPDAEPVLGLSMLLWDAAAEEDAAPAAAGSSANGRCCGALDLGDARRVAQQVGIPHYVLRMDEDFRRAVVDPFVDAYLEGRTPSPCVACNTWIKFDALFDRARAFGIDTVATGHYARIVDGPDGPELHAAVDASKDQSYFLFELTPEQLAASRFPLGEMTKERVRDLAREAGLAVAEKGESQDICFVASGIQEFVETQRERHPERFAGSPGTTTEEAAVVDTEGRELGRGSAPYYRYTVGQRRGLGVAAGERRYVLRVLPAANRVVVGDAEELLSPGLDGERTHWIGDALAAEAAAGPVEVTVKIRSRHPGVAAVVHDRGDGRVRVTFAEPQRGVTPGQAAVFYRGSRVLGGCWIASGPTGQEASSA